jgi:hypothetical protein
MRTVTVRKGTGVDYSTGWHELTINNAKYGKFQETAFLQISFEEYPENFNLRVYAKEGNDGEEFAIANVFRFANAGISTETLNDGSGNVTLKLDDNPEHLVGKRINVFFYPEENNGNTYARAYSSIAPTVLEGAAETFTERDVAYWKKKAEERYHQYGKNSSSTVDSFIEETTEDDGLPY